MYEHDLDHETPADYGWIREDDIPNLDDCREFLEGMKEALYETGNVDKLEGMLEELCSQLDVEFELKEPKVELKKQKPNLLMHAYLDFQTAHINNMNQQYAR